MMLGASTPARKHFYEMHETDELREEGQLTEKLPGRPTVHSALACDYFTCHASPANLLK